MIHIVDAPLDMDWQPCVHKATTQRYATLTTGATVETQHGTLAGRAGDKLVEGVNGALYILTAEAFAEAYDT